jgi:hypothetical protein
LTTSKLVFTGDILNHCFHSIKKKTLIRRDFMSHAFHSLKKKNLKALTWIYKLNYHRHPIRVINKERKICGLVANAIQEGKVNL